jgi:heme/copper-type cytochrome/quinol oxidase subunit 3
MDAGESNMPIELWLLAGVLLLLVGLPLVIVWLDMAQGYLGATGQWLAATWLAGLLYLGATIFLEVDQQAQSLKCFNVLRKWNLSYEQGNRSSVHLSKIYTRS